MELVKGQPEGILTPITGKLYELFKFHPAPQKWFKARPAYRAWDRILYSQLMRIVEDGTHGTQMAISFTFGAVVIRGRNLQIIADAVASERCEFVQAFDPELFSQPTDLKAPFIEVIGFFPSPINEQAELLHSVRKSING